MSTEVVMPQMGESIAEGTITKWLKQVGERVERDEPLFEISTDKVDAEIPSPAAGTLTEIRFKEGDTVEVNTVVAVLDGAGAGAAAPQPAATAEPAPAPQSTAAPQSTPARQPVQSPPQPVAAEPPQPPAPAPQPAAPKPSAEPTVEDLRRTKSSPLVRKIAQEHNVDISKLEGTGLSGRVTKNDILSYIEPGSTAPAARPAEPARQPEAAPAAPPARAPQVQPQPAPVELPAPPPPRPQLGA